MRGAVVNSLKHMLLFIWVISINACIYVWGMSYFFEPWQDSLALPAQQNLCT